MDIIHMKEGEITIVTVNWRLDGGAWQMARH
jgi:hypothetical protein